MTGALLTPPLFLIGAAAAGGHEAEDETVSERERQSEEGKARVMAAGKTSCRADGTEGRPPMTDRELETVMEDAIILDGGSGIQQGFPGSQQ